MGTRGIFKKKWSIPETPAGGRAVAIFALATLASVPAHYGQQSPPLQMEKTDESAQAELTKKQEPPHLPDIVSDNLDQVSATAERRKLQFDLYYVCKASPLLDLRTLLRTARVVFFRQGSR